MSKDERLLLRATACGVLELLRKNQPAGFTEYIEDALILFDLPEAPQSPDETFSPPAES